MGQTVYVSFSADMASAGATAQIDLYRDGQSEPEARSLPITLSKGSHVYTKRITLSEAGNVLVEARLDGVVARTLTIGVG
ncbi:hypothetical protein [Streptacidiphilus sp. MAP12-33]|uniref:hypothetical protein n=1 Tax=Streptacidiphilus sp. MAP12-33 TaxID=3156266 RepID=UPI003513842F